MNNLPDISCASSKFWKEFTWYLLEQYHLLEGSFSYYLLGQHQLWKEKCTLKSSGKEPLKKEYYPAIFWDSTNVWKQHYAALFWHNTNFQKEYCPIFWDSTNVWKQHYPALSGPVPTFRRHITPLSSRMAPIFRSNTLAPSFILIMNQAGRSEMSVLCTEGRWWLRMSDGTSQAYQFRYLSMYMR